MPSFGKSFSQKWTFAFVGVFIAVFIATGFFISRRISREEILQLQDFLTEQSELCARILEPALAKKNSPAELQSLVLSLRPAGEQRITLIRPDGVVLADSFKSFEEIPDMENHHDRPEVAAALQKGRGANIRYSRTLRMEMLYAAQEIEERGKLLGVVRISMPMTLIQKRVVEISKPVFVGLAAGAALILVAGFALGRLMTANMRRMTMAAVQYTRGDFSRKIVIDSDDELRVLADSMNHMAASLKRRIREAQQEKVHLSVILENMVEGVLAVDTEGQVVAINSSAEAILGVRRAEVLGKNFIESVFNHRLHEMLERAIEKHGMISGEIEIRRPDARILKVNAVGTQAAESSVSGILVFHDITQIRRLERLRRDFVANVSHELKTPITSIKGFIETLLGGALKNPAQSEHFLKMMDEDAQRLFRLVQDLLDLSRIESGETQLKLACCDLAAETDKVFGKIRFLADERGVRLESALDRARSPKVSADRDKLSQVLLNLIENAIKFNKREGLVTVEAESADGQVRVTVRDTGIGIPEAALPRIFERFYRVDASRSREEGGTGLGLAIVKHIIEAHGGTIACTSSMGRGSVFTFTLPAAG